MLSNVKQATIAPVIQDTIVPGTVIYTDDIDLRSPSRVGVSAQNCMSCQGEYARDEDGDGFPKFTSTRWKALVSVALMVETASRHFSS
jgi:hypothetical protein